MPISRILPPMLAFYNHPKTLDDIIDHTVTRVLDQFDIPAENARRWDGDMRNRTPKVHELK